MIQQRVTKYIEKEHLFSPDDKILIALSGGADSVALLYILHTAGYHCEAAHCNFHLRGKESDRDELFVRQLCERMEIHLHTIDFNTTQYATEKHISIEMAARELRYQWFEKIRKEYQADVIAVAHHQDDSIETILLNLIRGTGITGLLGIRPRNGAIVRPLLCINREEIIRYLQNIGQDYVTDSTNLEDEYTRNKIPFYVGIDCIIFGFSEGEISLLLLKRNFEPAMGEWSLMGGFVQKDESVDDAAKRVLHELTGLENVYMEQVGTFGAIDRDPGERVISVAYYALININKYDLNLVRKHNAHWVKINELPPLIFDHPEMVEKAQELMKQKASVEPIGFNLLPKLFTLTQLQSLYEAIYGETMDKRNFRKRVAEMDYIEKTDKIDKLSSKRGAALYKFNGKAYRKDPKFKI